MTKADLQAVLPHSTKERLGLSFIFLALGLVFASWAGRIPQLQEHLSLSDGQLGLSMFCLALGTIIAMPVSALLGARFGSARITIAFSLLFPCALVLLPLANSWPLFSLSLLIFGFGMGGQDVSMNAHAVKVEQSYQRPIMSSFHGTFSLGAMAGGAFSALVCTMDLAPSIHFALVSGIVIAGILFAGTTLQQPEQDGAGGGPVFVLPDRQIVVLAAVVFCSFVGEGAVSDWSAVYLDHELNGGATLGAAGFSVFSISMALCRFAGDGVVHKLGTRRVLFLGGLIAAGGLAMTLLVTSPLLALFAYLVVGVGFSLMVPVSFSAAGSNKDIPPSVAIAGVATVGYFGFVIAPPIIGLLADHFTLRFALWIIVGLSLVVSALSTKINSAGSTE